MAGLPYWQQLLDDRGLLEAALLAGWKAEGAGWRYPVFSTAGKTYHRWKAFDSSATPKYTWPDGKPDGCKYYMLDGAAAAIRETGALYIASGEPDVLAYRAAGFSNVLSWYGEQNLPPTLAADFALLGARSVVYYPDLDETGDDSARRVGLALSGTALGFCERRLPLDLLGPKGDINRLWIVTGFDRARFRGYLDACEPVKRERQVYDDLPSDFYAAIAQALHVERYEADGWSKPVRCPLKDHEHDDKRPAAAWHETKHIFSCFKCGITDMLARDIGAALGIDWREFIPRRQPPLTVRQAAPEVSAEPSPNGKPKIVYTWAEATDKVVDELLGVVDDGAREPLPMPFKGIAQLGGLARSLLPRKMIAIVGDSGDGKTSLTESVLDYWRKLGFSGIVYGPEWSKEEYVYRAIQRRGGPPYMRIVDHKAYYSAYKRGVPEEKRPGKPLSGEESDRAIELAEEIREWPGKLWFVEKLGITVEELMQRLRDIVLGAQQANEPIAFVALDYAQLLRSAGDKANERIDRALAEFKAFCVDYDLIGVVATQVTKDEGREVGHGNGKLTQHSMQNARGDYFNLILSINRKTNELGEKLPLATIRVGKNSLGRNGDVPLWLNEERLQWHDVEERTVTL